MTRRSAAKHIDEHNSSSSDSDYNVEEFIQPKRRRQPVNDESADLLGNFDDEKRKEIFEGTFVEKDPVRNPSDPEDSTDDEDEEEEEDEDDSADDDMKVFNKKENATTNKKATPEDDSDNENADADANESSGEINTNLSKEQLASLLRGASKTNRHVLYVTNLNFETQREDLVAHFSRAGNVKSVRIPKKRRGGFAFVEMSDLEGFQRGFQLHNTELQARNIKVQISEAGKKKSANKKNILKQKNRKLAEMRNEQKAFTKSGKFYDKNLSQEKAKERLASKRWRKPKPPGPPRS